MSSKQLGAVWTGHSFYDTFARIRWPQGDEPLWDEDGRDKRYEAYKQMANTRQTRKRTAQKGDRVGLLLDLDSGTLAVYKNDQRLGILSTELAGGEYCWAATLFAAGSSVRIEKKPLPDHDGEANLAFVQPNTRKRRVCQSDQGFQACQPKTAVGDQHTYGGVYTRIALDSAAYSTPQAHVPTAESSTLLTRGPPEPTEGPMDEEDMGPPEPAGGPSDEEEVVGVPALPLVDDEDEVTSILVVGPCENYTINPDSGDDHRGEDLLDTN